MTDVQQAVPVAQEAAIVAVTQEDRDAVQAFHHVMLLRLMSDVKSQRPKLGDDEGDAGTLVQAFARHRLDATQTREAELLEQIERALKAVDKIDVQAKCLEGYAEQDGHSGKAPASIYHWQATHFRDLATEIRAALNARGGA